ncbi:MAG: YhbY family RNA-binding protein [Clostridiales bacterium]|nr:YhbY family RNA-binding protein [Clostridiales bacterium]
MLTSKERAKLRSLANSIDPVFQIGKGNLSDTQIDELAAVLNKRELIKISVLKGCDYTADELISVLASELKAEPVAAIGNKIILYRRSDDKTVKHIEL